MIGKLLGNRYELIEKIGEGGMAEVYKAKCHLLHRNVAIKILKPAFINDQDLLEKFDKESKSAAMLSHANIVNIFDVGRENDLRYIVMEYINGETLKSLIDSYDGPMTNEAVIKLSLQIAKALEHAHAHGLVHRDIKPQNILIDQEGNAKVADFGIALFNDNNTIVNNKELVGSVHYTSPEQAKGIMIDEKSDIYSLGVVMYEMITGRLPFDDDNPIAIALKHVKESAEMPSSINPKCAPGIENIIVKSMQKDKRSRYQSVKEMIFDLTKLSSNPNLDIPVFNNSKNQSTVIMPAIEEEAELTEQKKGTNGKGKKANNKKPQKERVSISKMIIVLGLALALSLLSLSVYAYKVIDETIKTKPLRVPNVESLHIEDAKQIMNDAGFYVEISKVDFHKTVESGHVIKQSYKEGAYLKKGYTIRLEVSKGRSLIEVPNLINMKLSDAQLELEKLGLQLGSVNERENDLPKDYIFQQAPEAGNEVAKDAIINLWISIGSTVEDVLMPDLLGMTSNEAISTLSAFSLTGQIDYAFSNDYPEGTVMFQGIQPSTSIKIRSSVDITISKGREFPLENRVVPVSFITNFANEQEIVRIEVSSGDSTTVVYETPHGNTGEMFVVDVNAVQGDIINLYFGTTLVKSIVVE